MSVDKELKTYLQVLWLYKWVIAACAVIAFIGALGISFLVTPLYKATATLRVASAPGGMYDYTYNSASTQLSNTYVDIATSDTSLNKVVERLGLQKKPDVKVELVPETELIKITATNADPALSRDIANTLASLIVEQSTQLYGGNGPTAAQILEGQLQQAKVDLNSAVSEYSNAIRIAQSMVNPAERSTPVPNSDAEALARLVSVRQQIYDDLLQKYENARTSEQLRANAITIVDTAFLPKKPSTPNIPLNAVLGLSGGLALGVILAFLFEGMDDTLRGIEDVQTMTTLPILCRIPELKLTDRFYKGDTPPAPAFDQLSAHLVLFNPRPKSATFLITSPEPGVGKSTIISNLAISLALGGKSIVLVDMDLHRPRQHSILGLSNEKGLSNFLVGDIHPDALLQTTTCPNLRVITAGSSPNVSFDWFTPAKIDGLLEVLASECDYVLIDAPALLSVADPMMLVSQVDSVILVVARRETKRQNLRFALDQLAEFNAKVAGIVVNKMPNAPEYNYYSRRYTRSSLRANLKKVTNLIAADDQSKRPDHYEG